MSTGSPRPCTPVNHENTVVHDECEPHGSPLLDIISLEDLWKLDPMNDCSRVRTLDVSICSAEDASAFLHFLLEKNMSSLEQLKVVSRSPNPDAQAFPPLRAPRLKHTSFAGIFIELDAPTLIELDVTYDSNDLHRPPRNALAATLSRSSRLRRLGLTDCLSMNSNRTDHSLNLPSLERITLSQSAEALDSPCGSFLRALSFPSTTVQHISTMNVQDALDVLCVSAQRIWIDDTPSGLRLDVKFGYIGFLFYTDVRSHRDKDDHPFESATMRAEISLGVKHHHLPSLMQALASSVDLPHIKILSLCDDTSVQLGDEGAHWRSVFETCSGVRILHFADTRGAPQPSLLLALGARSEAIAYAEARSTTPLDDSDEESSHNGDDPGSMGSHDASSSSDETFEVDSGSVNEDNASISETESDSSISSESSSANRVPPRLETLSHPRASAATDEEITPFPMLAERLRQLQQTLFIALDSSSASDGDSSDAQTPTQEDVHNKNVDEMDAFVGKDDALQPSEPIENPLHNDHGMSASDEGETSTSSQETALLLPVLDILWLASKVDSDRPMNAYTFPLEALVRALTSRAKSHMQNSASRSPRTLRVDVSVALREPGAAEPHLLEARVRFPNILWSDD